MLNAFRHQRKKRFSAATGWQRSAYAQRLPASKEETLRISATMSLVWLECSTPSGIKGRNANRMRPTSARASDAQRLPASKEETLRGCEAWHESRRMLNAFRHQRKKRKCI